MIEKNRRVLLHLSLIPGVGPSVVLKIIKSLLDDLSNIGNHIQNDVVANIDLLSIYDYRISDFINKVGLFPLMSQKVFDGLRDEIALDKELSLIEKHGIELLTLLDEGYPVQLNQIYLPPTVLYCKGRSLNSESKNIAIVGARKANDYARCAIEELVYGLVSADWHIISGGAFGADSMAHNAALDSKGITVAVIGSGLLNYYPLSNKNLFKRIANEGGTLVSPFPLFAPPEKGNFPARNRVISGLSKGCIVAQAAKRSGALITANFALEQGRQVFAIPGSIFDELSAGPNELIKQGAKIVSCIDDILEEFGEESVLKSMGNEASNADFKKPKASVTTRKVRVKKMFPVETDPILKELSQSCSMDELSVKTGFGFVELQDKLFEFQISGKIKQNFAGNWELV